MQDVAGAQPFPAILTNVDVEFSRVICIALSMCRRVLTTRAADALTSLRQHFLKRDTVFFNVLVYSE
jgi:hypothetical protein